LAEQAPEGLHYACFRLEDGVSFLHVAVLDGDGNPLSESPAFAEFQSAIKDRTTEGPIPSDARVVGSFRMTSE
jgi:hypothetical protein